MRPYSKPISPDSTLGDNRKILQIFWIVAFCLCSWVLFFSDTSELLSIGAALVVVIAALFPAYLWCSKRALGRPIFPLFAITFIWTYALPFVSNSSGMMQYTSEQRWFAGITTASFLAIATFIWFQFVHSAPKRPQSYRVLLGNNGDNFLLAALALGTLFSLNNNSKFLDFAVFFTLIRGIILALNALASFTLSYKLGKNELTRNQKNSFLFLLSTLLISSTVGLLLINSLSIFVVAIAGFTTARRRIPLRILLISLMCFVLLHFGKGEMRVKYGFGPQVQPWDYPAWFVEWSGYSLNYLTPSSSGIKVEEKQSFTERSSVVQLLLLTQTKSPSSVPYLNGATYAIIPQLFTPRIFNNSKIASHEGTYLLNIHYGRQTRQDTLTTTIGWGLLAESYANFGIFGCGGLAVVIGILYGQITRWGINSPLLSDRSLLNITMLTYAFQSEFSAGVYVAALFQSGIVLLGLSIFLMKSTPSEYFIEE
jgi:hypothetical protein